MYNKTIYLDKYAYQISRDISKPQRIKYDPFFSEKDQIWSTSSEKDQFAPFIFTTGGCSWTCDGFIKFMDYD